MRSRDAILAALAPALRQAWLREPEPPRLVSIFGCASGGTATPDLGRPPAGRAVAALRSPATDARWRSGRLPVAAKRGPSVHYLLDRGAAGYEEIAVEAAAELGSLTPLAPAAAWHEREVHDRFGTVFAGHPDLKPLLRPAPLTGGSAGDFEFTPVTGEGITEVAVGPVHAGIIEPGHFRFSTMGDRVVFLELRHFYTHKGTEDLLAGMDAALATPLVESVSGDNCLAHAVAYCDAVEQIAGLEPPPRAQALRLAGLELERLLAHVGDFGALCGDVGFAPMPALAGRIKEDLLRASARFCGARYWRGIAVPGGVTVDPAATLRQDLACAVAAAEREFVSLAELALRTPSVEARFEGAGVLPLRAVRDWAAVGPVARASGAGLDLRSLRPTGAYRGRGVTPPVLTAGDVMARARIRVLEASASAQLILDALADWPDGPVRRDLPADLDGCGLGCVESPRGELLYWLLLRAGHIQRCHIRSPSFQNWPALPSAVIGGVIADFPMINKSFNLSYSGCDR